MPKFEVTLRRTLEETMTVIVRAKDEDAAQQQVENNINGLGTAAKIATHYKEHWEEEVDNIEIEDVSES